MSIETHVAALNTKHAEIEDVIAREEHRPNPDSLRLAQLKKKKLRIKEELAQFASKH